MEKGNILLPKNIWHFIFSFIIYFTVQDTYSQCTNPVPTGNESQVFCKTDSSAITDLVAEGGTIVWFDSPTGGTQYNNSTSLFNDTIYYADDINNGNCSVSRLAVTVTVYGDVPTNVDVFVGKCASDNPTIADLSVTGSNVEWYSDQIEGSFLANSNPLVSGETYWVQQTENGCASDRLPTTVTIIDPTPPAAEPIQSFCGPPNPTINDLQATGTNITWYDSETSDTPLDPTTSLENGQDYWASQGSFPCESTIRSETMVVLETRPNAGTNGSYIECEADFITQNLFEFLGGTPDTTGTWSGPSDLSNDYLGTFEPGVNVLGIYTYTVPSVLNICPNTSSDVTVDIIIVPPPSTTESNQTFCEIVSGSIADLNATGNGIIWYDTETSTTPLDPSELLIDGEDYWATQIGTADCESTSRLVVTVEVIIPPPPTTSATTQTFCDTDLGTIADLNATGSNITWYDTETSTTPLDPSELLVEGEDYWASQIGASGCESNSRLVVTAVIIVPPPPTTSETTQTFCDSDLGTIADLNADGNSLVWYDTETSTTPLDPSELLVDNEDYWATQIGTADCESTSRLMVTVLIIIPPPPTTSETTQTFCEIVSGSIADLNTDGNGIIWYDTETSMTPLDPAELLVDGEDYWATQTTTSGCESTSRLVITVEVIVPPPPSTTESNQTFCEIVSGSIADLNATGNGIIWYDTETSTTPLDPSELLIDGEDYWATQIGTADCESTSRLVVTVEVIIPPPPTTSATTQTFCDTDLGTIADLNATGSNITWYDTETSTTPLDPSELLVEGEDYWASQIGASGCESNSRLAVSVTILTPIAPSTSDVNQTYCSVDQPTIADLNVNGESILWYETETSTTPLNNTDLLVDGQEYWAAETDNGNGCVSPSRLRISAFVTNVASATISNISQDFCVSNLATVADLQAAGNGIIWYGSETGNTALNLSELLIDGEDYWAVQSDANTGCESSVRVVVQISLITIATPQINTFGNEFCEIDNPTISDLSTNISSANNSAITWYDSYPNGAVLSSSELLRHGNTYYALEENNDGCMSMNPLEVTVNLEACDDYDIEIYDGFSPTGNGVNDSFTITNLRQLYPDFKVEFYNRWGNLVYTSNASKVDWNGRLNGDGELSPAGVYYFIIYFNKNNRKPIQRRLYLSR